MSSTVKISELPVLASADAADEFVVVDDSAGVTKKITQAGLADFGSNTLTAAGITFGADTLDDYEEGTWTPSITGGSTAGTASYSNRNAKYIKVGDLVWIEFLIKGSFTSTPTGVVYITGLPFTSGALRTLPTTKAAIGYATNNAYFSVGKNTTRLEAGYTLGISNSTTSAHFGSEFDQSDFLVHLGLAYTIN